MTEFTDALHRLGDRDLRLVRYSTAKIRDMLQRVDASDGAAILGRLAEAADDELRDRPRQHREAQHNIAAGDIEDAEARQELIDLFNEEEDGEWTADPPPNE